MAFFENGDFQNAIDYLNKALKYSENDEELLLTLGFSYFNEKFFSKAINSFNQIIDFMDSSVAFYGIGQSYFAMENYNKAIEYFEKAIKIEPDNQDYYDSYKAVIKEKKLSLRNNNDSYKAKEFKKRGDQFLEFKDYRNAIINYKEAIKFDSANQEIHEALAHAYNFLNKPTKDGDKFVKFVENTIIDEENTQNSSLDKINGLIGLRNIKEEINSLINFLKVEKLRKEKGISSNTLTLHMVFKGSPGTGKTTVARLLGEILKDLGFLKLGHVIEVSRSELVAEYVGQTAVKTNNVINKALDGILFIDEAYTLNSGNSEDYGKEAIDTILKRMEDERDRLVVIIAGYTDEIEKFININPGFRSRFTRHFYFEDFTPTELLKIATLFAKNRNFNLHTEAEPEIFKYFEQEYQLKDKTFGNGRLVRNIFEEFIKVQANRLAQKKFINEADLQMILPEDVNVCLKDKMLEPKKSLESLLLELDDLIGLKNIKNEIRGIINYIKIEQLRRKEGIEKNPISLHFIFYGSPGTGKTTVARLLGQIMRSMGLLRRGHIIEVDRSKLVGEFMGETASKTNRVIDSALDGVLFIDEAYSLYQGYSGFKDYGQEAIDTLLKRMEDDRDRLIVIAAGYTNKMTNFVESNPGLKSRFTRFLEFTDYSPEELVSIFENFIKHKSYKTSSELKLKIINFLQDVHHERDEYFGNARFVRNLFERLIQIHAQRISSEKIIDKNSLIELTADDFELMIKDKKTTTF